MVDQVDTAGIMNHPLLFAALDDERLEDVALACSPFAGDKQVVLALDKGEVKQGLDGAAVKLRLEVPIEVGHGFAFRKAAAFDPRVGNYDAGAALFSKPYCGRNDSQRQNSEFAGGNIVYWLRKAGRSEVKSGWLGTDLPELVDELLR
jgi:hypothetical protein